MKKILYLFAILSLLTANILVISTTFADDNDEFNESFSSIIGVRLDLTKELEQLGYTAENLPKISGDLLRILITQNKKSIEPLRAQDYSKALNPNNILRLDPPKPTTSNELNSSASKENNGEPSILDYYGDKACLIVGIWTYPYSSETYPWSNLSGWFDDAFYDLCYHVAYDGDYDNIITLAQSAATISNIDNWITWLCMYYENVDVYFFGHGGVFEIIPGIWYYWGYSCWDACSYPDGEPDSDGVYLPWDLYTHQDEWGTDDRSTLRMSIFGCCWGGVFDDPCINPGGNVNHDRAFAGGNGNMLGDYVELYTFAWGNYWYNLDYASDNAWYYSEQYAVNNSWWGTNQTRYEYEDTGYSIYK